ncbi:MAG: FecR domain-containing protein [Geminicoccaceae bacterium]
MRLVRALALAGLSAAVVTGADARVLRPSIGEVEKLVMSAEALFEARSRELGNASNVYFEDTLRTGRAARLQARLADDTVLTLGENAEVLIDEFVYQPWSNEGQLDLNVVAGAFLFVGGRVEDGGQSEVTIKTPVGTLGIRGTTVWGGHIDGGYGVLVLDGEVEVETANGTVLLRGGQGTMVYEGEAPEAAAPWPQDRTARAVKTISFPSR